MKIKNTLLTFVFLLPGLSYSQTDYLVGTSRVATEPDQSLISLHLAGYGAPKAGRFTLQWKDIDALHNVTSIGSGVDNLYLISNNELFWKNPADNKSAVIRSGAAENIRSVTGIKNQLYALNKNGELLESKAHRRIQWRKIGSADNPATHLASSNGKLFAANNEGSIWSADLSGDRVEWIKLEFTGSPVSNTVSFAASNRKLYLLTGEGEIYQAEIRKKKSAWLKLAYRNGETIKEDIRDIAIVNDRIYGVSRENVLYRGEHRSDGNLTARAMAIKKDAQTVVIVNADVCGLNDTFTGLIKKEIYLKHQLPPSAIFINSTHTHFAPVTQKWLTWQEPNQMPDSTYLYSTVKTGIIDAIGNALKNMVPAELSFGRGTTDIGYNRSLKDHPELYDPAVDVIRVNYTGTNTESYLFLTACHPVFSTAGTLHYTISANYPGVARKLVEERTRTSNALFLQGTAGDVNPKDNGEYITGEKLANEVIAVLGRPMTKIIGPITCFLDTINFPVTPWSKAEINAYRADNTGKTGDVYAEKNLKWCDLMVKYLNEGTMPKSMPVYVNTINIGNWKLVGFSRETTTGYGLGVKNFWPGKLVSVAGYTNDVSSYLPTHMHIEAGTYEGKDSFFWYGMPNIFPRNVDETILNSVKALGR